jgi:hypothetical protein
MLYPRKATKTHGSSAGKLAKPQLSLDVLVPTEQGTLLTQASLLCGDSAQMSILVLKPTPSMGTTDVKEREIHTPVIPALGKLRQKDHKFEASWVTQEDSCHERRKEGRKKRPSNYFL